jgi:hypothetical protein
MRYILSATAMAFVTMLAVADVSAQNIVNLSGRYICVHGCLTEVAGRPAHITQNGWDMNLVNEVGMSSRAWIDWPGHIWVPNFSEGAIYSPDGMVIQFDHGTIWQRDLGLLASPPRRDLATSLVPCRHFRKWPWPCL